MMKSKSNISDSIPKRDSSSKIKGQAKYVGDLVMDGMLYAKTLRSTQALARFTCHYPSLPEGYFIVDEQDVVGTNIVKIIYDDMPFFASQVVRHIGEPIALVIGKDKEVILSILAQIQVTYEELPAVFEWTHSVVHYQFQKGDPEFVFSQAHAVFERTYQTDYQEQAYIEPQGMLAYPEGDKITLTGSIQCPYYVKNACLQALGCEEHLVRVIQAEVGGAFGGKEEYPSIIACQLATAVHKIKQPIQLLFEREEDILSSTKRHPSKTTMKAYLDASNQLLGLEVHVGLDGGEYIGLSGVVLSRAMIISSGVYTIANLKVSGDVYQTNTVPTGAFRGFGAPQMVFAIEMFMAHLAKHLHQDIDEFKYKYLAKQGDKTSTSGTYRDPIILPDLIQQAKILADYDRKKRDYDFYPKGHGIGMSLVYHGCGFTGSGEAKHIHAKVRLEKDEFDDVWIYTAAVEMGQGIKTTLPKIVSHILNRPYETIHFDAPDTDFVPDSGPTVASRTTMIVGGLVAQAAKELLDQWQTGIRQTVEKSYVQPKDIVWDDETFQGDAYPAYSFGVVIVEVFVDPDTYQVEVKQVYSAYDMGKAIDERVVLGQIDGGQLQGIAYGYLEVMNHQQGRILQKNFTDYIIPTAVDTPSMERVILDNPYAFGPYGAKGTGELTLVGGAPAVALAIEQAIQREVNRIPITPERIGALIHDE